MEDNFLINAKTDDYINIDFSLIDYSIQKVNGSDQVFLNENKQAFNSGEQKISTFIRLDNHHDYDIQFNVELEKTYNFKSEDDFDLGRNLRYSIDEHIFRGIRLLEITVYPFFKNEIVSFFKFCVVFNK